MEYCILIWLSFWLDFLGRIYLHKIHIIRFSYLITRPNFLIHDVECIRYHFILHQITYLQPNQSYENYIREHGFQKDTFLRSIFFGNQCNQSKQHLTALKISKAIALCWFVLISDSFSRNIEFDWNQIRFDSTFTSFTNISYEWI